MPATKKRNKRYVPKAAKIPGLLNVAMTRDAHPELAFKLYGALIAFIDKPAIASCNWLSFQLTCIAGGMSHANKGRAILGRTDAASVAIKSAIMTVEAIVARHDRTGVVAVTELEAQTLRAAAGKLDDALANIPLPAYTRAVKEVEAFTGERA